MTPEDILPAYDREAAFWANNRMLDLYERPFLAAALAGQRGAKVLDLGCGTGLPIAAWFLARGCHVTGVDGAAAMMAQFQANLPDATPLLLDMRKLDLAGRFDVILSWDSFFHLSADDQKTMFPVFAAHAAPGARLMLTTGTSAGESVGKVGESPVFHASHAPETYRAMMADNGFSPLWFRPEDRYALGRSVWLAQYH